MEIKPGKYKTRDGRQAVVLEVFEGKAFGRASIRGSSVGFWEEYSWYLNGRYFINEETVSNHDLIAPWEEPKPRLRVWRANSPKYIKGLTVISEEAPNHPDYPPGEWQPVPELDALFERSEWKNEKTKTKS